MRKGTPWTDSESELVERFYGTLCPREIGKLCTVRRTRNAVIGRANRLGLAKSAAPAIAKPPPLTDVDFTGCRFIAGDPLPIRPGLFCGRVVVPGASYCAEHMARIYVQAPP